MRIRKIFKRKEFDNSKLFFINDLLVEFNPKVQSLGISFSNFKKFSLFLYLLNIRYNEF